jgi:hypothetical protein
MPTNYADVAALTLGLVLPAIVAVFTRPSTSPTIKGFAHAVLATATGFAAVRQGDPENYTWAPALGAAFLAWLTGTVFYHSLLKKYGWFGWLQNALVREAKTLHIRPVEELTSDFEQALEAEESGPSNNFPLSTDAVPDETTEPTPEPAPEPPVDVAQPAPATV